MLKTLGIVEVTTTAREKINGRNFVRDPVMLAQSRFGSTSLLEWIIRRVTDAQRLDGVITLLDRNVAAQIGHLVPADVPLLACSHTDPLDRVVAAIDKVPARAVVRVGVRTPFVDPELIDRLVASADQNPECDYVSYRSHDHKPLTVSHLGLFAEWCRAEALRRAQRVASRQTEHLENTNFFAGHPELFQMRFLQVPSALDRDDFRLTLTDQIDLEHAEEIYEALGADRLSWQRIAELLDQQPALREKMADLNRAEVTSEG